MTRYLRPAVTVRRFTDGDMHEFDGIGFRIVRGSKAPGDLRLDWWTGSQWRAVRMESVGFMADFLYENEHVLYPPPYKGGEKFREYLNHAMQHGHHKAEAGLRLEREAKESGRTEQLFGEAS